MAALPGTDWLDETHGASARRIIRHQFTHFALELAVERRESPLDDNGWWQAIDRLEEAGLPTLYRKAAKAMLAEGAEALDEAASAP